MTLSQIEFSHLVAEANLAPSVHNTQPTRWRLEPNGGVIVLEDVTRLLSIGDPTGHDAGISHGAVIEGFALACGELGLKVDTVEPIKGEALGGLRPVARLSFAPGGATDALRGAVPLRHTYRGAFVASNKLDAALDNLERSEDICIVRNPQSICDLAELNDAASLRTFRNAAYRAELLSWMRLSRRDPRWSQDGLNAKAMQMTPIEAVAAGFVLKPGVFETLDWFGSASPLVAEAKVVRSAAAIALFHRAAAEPTLVTGRRFYRFWLELAALGLSAAPMAVLADDEEARGKIATQYSIPPQRRLVTTFRIGRAPNQTSQQKPRLSTRLLEA